MQTCWTLVEEAAAGDGEARGRFAETYLPVVRAYLASRWAGGAMLAEIEDAVQECFIECFREGGALQRIDAPRGGRFRTYLYAVVTNVARRFEERRGRDPKASLPDLPADDPRASRAFDRAWAEALLRRASERMLSAARGEEALRRVALLRLRFGEGKPIREIAKSWGADPAHVHHEYARAREEFKQALLAEVNEHGAPDPEEACLELLESLHE